MAMISALFVLGQNGWRWLSSRFHTLDINDLLMDVFRCVLSYI